MIDSASSSRPRRLILLHLPVLVELADDSRPALLDHLLGGRAILLLRGQRVEPAGEEKTPLGEGGSGGGVSVGH